MGRSVLPSFLIQSQPGLLMAVVLVSLAQNESPGIQCDVLNENQTPIESANG